MSKQSSKKNEVEFISVRSPNKTSIGKPVPVISNYVAVAVLALISTVFFWGHITGNVFMWEDFMEMYYPFQHFAAKGFHSGHIPFWNPYVFAGMPFTADLQNGFFYIGHQLVYLLSGGNLSVHLLQVFLVVHYFIAMVGAWKLSKTLGASNWGGILSGLTYGLSGFLVVRMIHHAVLIHLAWFPLIVALFYKGVTERNYYYSFLCSIVLGITLLSGHPQMTLYIVFFLGALAMFILINDFRNPEKKKTIVSAIVNMIIPVVLGVGIYAIQFLPAQELAPISRRAEMTYQQALDGAMSPSQIFTLVLPKLLGYSGAEPKPDSEFWFEGKQRYYYWETVVYFGVVGLILMVVALASNRLGGLRWFLLGMGLLGLFYGMGDKFFIHSLVWNLPFFKLFRNPVRMASFLVLGASVLSGFGLDELISNNSNLIEKNKLAKVGLISGLVVALLGLLTVTGFIPKIFGATQEVLQSSSSSGVIALIIGAAVGIISYLVLKGSFPKFGAVIAILVLTIIDLFAFGIKQNQGMVNPEQVYQATNDEPSMQGLKSNPPKDIFRVNMRNQQGMLMKRNQGCISDIMLIEGYNPLLLQRIIPPAKDESTSNDLLNVKFGIETDDKGGAGLTERKTAYPHVRFVYNAIVTNDDSSASKLMKDPSMDFSKTAVVNSDKKLNLSADGVGTANITSYDNQQISIDAQTDKNGLLLLSEIWFPAWKVFIDGKETNLLRTNYSLRGVEVPSGKHKVEFKYESVAFDNGLIITSISGLIAVICTILFGIKNRKLSQIN
jgi:hypothetical protein